MGDNLEPDSKRSRHNSEEEECLVTVASLPSSSSSSQSNIFVPTKTSNAADEQQVKSDIPNSSLISKWL